MKELFSSMYEYQTESAIIDVSNFATEQMTSTDNAVCHLRILQSKTTTMVIATELATNPGMSITNAAEVLAEKIIRQFRLNPKTTRFIEHYGQESYDYEEGRKRADTYDEVTFSWNGTTPAQPTWKPIEAEVATKRVKNNRENSMNVKGD